MHVIECAGFSAPYAGSFVPMLAAVATEAAARGHRTSIVLPQEARDRPWLGELEALADVRLVDIGAGRAGIVRPAIRELKSLLDDSGPGPAVIHTHFTEFDIPAALMRLRRRDLAVIWQEHSPLVPDRRVVLRNRARMMCLAPLVHSILCVSPDIRAGLRARGAPERKLVEFPNAIDTARFAPPAPEARAGARRKLGIDPDSRVVLHFAWSWLRKGGDLMLAAAERLASEPKLEILTVLGEDRAGAPADLERHTLVRPLAPTNDVRTLYAAADLFLSVSRAEGMPFAVLEALASGLLLVVSDLPGQRAVLEGLPGTAIVSDEPSAIADGIRAMLALDDKQRAEHASAARARVGASFALEAWARRLLDLYEGAVRGARTWTQPSSTST